MKILKTIFFVVVPNGKNEGKIIQFLRLNNIKLFDAFRRLLLKTMFFFVAVVVFSQKNAPKRNSNYEHNIGFWHFDNSLFIFACE